MARRGDHTKNGRIPVDTPSRDSFTSIAGHFKLVKNIVKLPVESLVEHVVGFLRRLLHRLGLGFRYLALRKSIEQSVSFVVDLPEHARSGVIILLRPIAESSAKVIDHRVVTLLPLSRPGL